MGGDIGTTNILLLVVFVVLSAFFSGSEAALLSVQRVRIQHLVSTKTPGAAKVARMVERPDKLLPPILLGNNLVNTAVAALATAMAISVADDQSQGILIATVLVTVTLLIFGEAIPKTMATRNAERFSIVIAFPIQWISFVLRPTSFLLELISAGASRAFGGREREAITEEEIKTIVSVGSEEGVVERGEAQMIRRVLEFGDRHVREVMTPRPEIVWIERGATIQQFLQLYGDQYHTRFPVFEGTLDNVAGVVAVKDVMRLIATGSSLDSVAMPQVRPVRFVPETKRVQELFDEMRASGDQLAMIVDEFGGVAGLVTLKRLIEDIVGRVGDEDNVAYEEVVEVGTSTFDLEGSVSISDANERLGLALPSGEYETIAGFLLEQIGSVPKVGREMAYGGATFTVTEMQGVRISRVLVVVLEATE